MKIWLIRHGTTRPGEEQRYQGRLDEGLSERGRKALLRADLAYPCVFGDCPRVPGACSSVFGAGEAAAAAGGGTDGMTAPGSRAGRMPAYVYVSPARRARQTAEILFPQADQIIIPGLREMDFGVFEGRSWREMSEDADYRRWVDGGCEGQCPGGEDRASFTARICSAFDGILAGETETGRKPGCAGDDLPVIIVAHGGTQMALLAERGSPAGDYFSRQTPCGCGWLLEPEAGTGLLKVLKEVSFLRP